MNHRSFFLTSVRVLTLCLLASYAAADSRIDELFDMDLEDLMKIKVTSSTLTDESLKTVPSSMTVYTRADIRRMGLHNLAELVNYVPGFQSYRSDYSSINRNISSRGRALSANGVETLILIDGQRLNNDWSGGTGQTDSLIPLENIERVEFIRGPGSAIYGSNAMTGVINIVTRSEHELLLETGNNESHHGSVQWHADGENSKLDIYSSHAQSNGETLKIFNPDTKPPTEINSRDPYNADDFYLRGELGELSLAARATSRDTQQFYTVGFADNASNYNDSRSDFINVGWKHELADTLSLEGHISQSHKAFYLRSDISAGAGTLIEGGIEEQELATQWVLQGGNDDARWLVGWEWRNPELTNTDAHIGTFANPYGLAPLVPQAPEDGRYINSEFVQLQLALNNTLALTTGLRHDDYSDTGEHSSPRIALVQQLGEHDTVKGLYSEAFRAPSRIETSSNSLVNLKNPDLKPETAKTTELIWLHLLDTGMVSTTLFDSQINNAITNIAISPSARKPVNRELTVAGLELEWQNHWSENWQSRIAFTHIFDPVGDIHTQSSNLFGGSLSYENQGWTATLLANFQSNMVDPNEQVAPISTTETTDFGGHTIYGAHLAYRVMPELECYFNADNLFDKQYRSPAFTPNNYEGAPGTGRVLMLGFRWEFE